MSLAEQTLDRLLQLTPTPLSRVDWSTSWVREAVIGHEQLTQLRLRVAKILYAHPEIKEIETLWQHVQTLDEYAGRLSPLVRAKTMPCRRGPLAFDWSFKAETFNAPKDMDTFENMMDMRSTYIGFEQLCVMVSACILSFRRAQLLLNRDGPSDQSKLAFVQTCDLIDRTHATFDSAFSAYQWSCLKEQGLPMQMHRQWIAFFGAYIRYSVMLSFKQSQSDYLLKIAAQETWKCASEWLLDLCVTQAQSPVVQAAYDISGAMYIRHNVLWHNSEARRAEEAAEFSVAVAINNRSMKLIESMSEEDRLKIADAVSECTRSRDLLLQMQATEASNELVDKWYKKAGYSLGYCQ